MGDHIVAEQSPCFCKFYVLIWTEKHGSDRVKWYRKVNKIIKEAYSIYTCNAQLLLLKLVVAT